MSRPRLDAEQKKVSFSLAFSPNLISVLEKVRGSRSQSVFVEEWLRQNPLIAAELVAMNDPGFTPPVVRYEQLVDHILAFCTSRGSKKPSLVTIMRPLLITHRTIMRSQDHDLEGQIVAAVETFWRTHEARNDRGEKSLEAVESSIKDYAHYYTQVIFHDMAKGERKILQQRFRSLIHGCQEVYQGRLKKEAQG